MKNHSPIHILGAGPAGLCSAIVLARAGCDVHVHERYDVIGKRFQGDLQGLENWTLKENVLTQLQSFGLEINFEATPFSEVILHDGKRAFKRTASEPLFYLVKRGPFPRSLDTALGEQALKAGVHIHYQSRLPAEEADIVATGPLRRCLIASDRGIVFPTNHPDIAVGIFHDELAYKGYSYFLVTNGYGCICSVVFEDFHTLNKCFEKTVEVVQRDYGIEINNPQPVGGVGSFVLNQPKQQGRTLFVGESAGLQDLLWGFGIRTAITSGYLAAQALLDGHDYTTQVQQKLIPFLKASIVNRYLWEKIKIASRPVIPMLMRIPFPLKSSFRWLYGYTPIHHVLYSKAEKYVQKHYNHSIENEEVRI